MKTTLTTIATALILFTAFSSFAANRLNPLKNVESSKVILAYVETTTMGSMDFNKYLFANDFEYCNTTSGKKYNRKQYTNFLKQHKGLTFDCETSYEILDQVGNTCIAKATLAFHNFTRVDYITLKQGEEGWKITKVETTYPTK